MKPIVGTEAHKAHIMRLGEDPRMKVKGDHLALFKVVLEMIPVEED
ncbi:hypothetical protein [Rubellicoccus peritrichatus]|uniref:Uncharacterized protein n=1 Tax=Rubellicoccus peritrichatus TaxID=3080537 RepID=A0AAQ3QTI8_9BACT|nr:hypothetical protein [Puniceicoccus sp. CR14]WOO39438.1 hypothetical protein RZN69_12510 [Puniceicoccus sp. CR14]